MRLNFLNYTTTKLITSQICKNGRELRKKRNSSINYGKKPQVKLNSKFLGVCVSIIKKNVLARNIDENFEIKYHVRMFYTLIQYLTLKNIKFTYSIVVL